MKRFKCKYCGKPIYWEKDGHGRPRAVEKYIYYKEDPAGSLHILTSSGDIVRATADPESSKVGAVLHAPRCAPVPMYVRGGGYTKVKSDTRGRGIIDDSIPIPKEEEDTAVPEVEQMSLFDLI